MSGPTKEEAQRMLDVALGFKGREWRDVALRLPEILRAYIEQMEETASRIADLEATLKRYLRMLQTHEMLHAERRGDMHDLRLQVHALQKENAQLNAAFGSKQNGVMEQKRVNMGMAELSCLGPIGGAGCPADTHGPSCEGDQ